MEAYIATITTFLVEAILQIPGERHGLDGFVLWRLLLWVPLHLNIIVGLKQGGQS